MPMKNQYSLNKPSKKMTILSTHLIQLVNMIDLRGKQNAKQVKKILDFYESSYLIGK